MPNTDSKPKFLGTVNAWSKFKPELELCYKNCKHQGYERLEIIPDSNWYRYTCQKCNISWEEDSSG